MVTRSVSVLVCLLLLAAVLPSCSESDIVKSGSTTDEQLHGLWYFATKTVDGELESIQNRHLALRSDGTGGINFGSETILLEWSTSNGQLTISSSGDITVDIYSYEQTGNNLYLTRDELGQSVTYIGSWIMTE